MRVEMSTDNFNAMLRVAKLLPADIRASENVTKRGNRAVSITSGGGTVMRADGNLHGELVVAIVQAVNLLREIAYIAHIENLRDELNPQ